jgi:peptidoglycan hydrolase CwlO-like protein
MKRLISLVVVSLIVVQLISIPISRAEEVDGEHERIFIPLGVGGELDDKQSQIEILEKKVKELQGQAVTLAGQIAAFDSQIELTTLKIAQTEAQIKALTTKIDQLEIKLQDRSKLLDRQIVHTYKDGGVDPFEVIFSAGDVSAIIQRFKYLQIVQVNNRKFLYDTQVVQSNYSTQKNLVAESKKKLQGQKEVLTSLRAERDNLLVQTKSSEAVYQKQLERARLELEAIQRALASGKKEGPVKKGDPIALVGNSGYPSCSTGKHLHFEVRQDDKWVNAESYVKGTSVIDQQVGGTQTVGSGSWDWPLGGNITVTQHYGKTPYSYVYAYSGGIHTGIDMTSTQDLVHAVADGDLYSYTTKCGSSNLNIKYIDHGGGLKTFYLHIQ